MAAPGDGAEKPDSLISADDGRKYWAGIDADVNGMLGGYPAVSRVDLRGSRSFLAKLGLGRTGGVKGIRRALEGGAGYVFIYFEPSISIFVSVPPSVYVQFSLPVRCVTFYFLPIFFPRPNPAVLHGVSLRAGHLQEECGRNEEVAAENAGALVGRTCLCG